MRQLLLALLMTLPLAILTHPRPLSSQESSTEPGFKTTHVFDLETAEDEVELTRIMGRFNALFHELGHPECRYHLWRLEGEGGLPGYLWESTWPTRAVYDEVHALPAFEALLAETFARLSQLLANSHQYSQYSEIPIGSPGEV